MSNDAVISYTDEETGFLFRWHGGAYIEVCTIDCITDGTYEAFDVINVWDYEHDVSHLEVQAMEDWTGDLSSGPSLRRRPFSRTLELFEEQCRAYIAEQTDDCELTHEGV